MNIELLKSRMKQFFTEVDVDDLVRKYEVMGYKLVPIDESEDSEAVESIEKLESETLDIVVKLFPPDDYSDNDDCALLYENIKELAELARKTPQPCTTN